MRRAWVVGLCLMAATATLSKEAWAATGASLQVGGELPLPTGVRSQLLGTSVSSSRSDLDTPLRFCGRTSSLGRFCGSLTTRRHIGTQFDKDTVFLQGHVQGRRAGKRVNGVAFATLDVPSQDRGTMRLFVEVAPRSSKRRSRISEIRAGLSASSGTVAVTSARAIHPVKPHRHCGKDHGSTHAHDHDHDLAFPTRKAEVSRSLSILLEGDHEYAEWVDNFPKELATIVNGVDAIYKRDLGVELNATVVSEPQPYSREITYVGRYWEVPLMQEMQERRPAGSRGAAVHLLMTGKEPTHPELEDLAGLAFDIGVVCRRPEDSVAFTLRWDTAYDILTTAHELGHLLGGEHDDDHTKSTEGWIMHSGTVEVRKTIDRFSDYSKQQLGKYMDRHGSCISEIGDPVPSITATINAAARPVITVKGIYGKRTPAAHAQVEMWYAKRRVDPYEHIGTETLNAKGRIKLRPLVKGFYQFSIDGVTSKPVRVRKVKKRVKGRANR